MCISSLYIKLSIYAVLPGLVWLGDAVAAIPSDVTECLTFLFALWPLSMAKPIPARAERYIYPSVNTDRRLEAYRKLAQAIRPK